MEKKKILITGGAGFFGHHLIEHILKTTDWYVASIDKLSYASRGFDRIKDICAFDSKRLFFYTSDLINPISEGILKELGGVNYIVHAAASTHVDRSITHPEEFIMSNVIGTMNILNFARKLDNLEAMIQISTDEVLGPAPKGTNFKEWDRYNCTNAYSASKAGAEQLCLAYANCYNLPLAIVRSMNLFGERQHPEKFIPLCIKKILSEEKIYIHSDPTKTISGSRFYIHCRNLANALMFIFENIEHREIYHVVGEKEVSNLDLALFIGNVLSKPVHYELINFHESRPGHDLRYALDGTKMYNMGWRLPLTFEKSLEKTIKWTLDNKDKWLF